MTDDGIYTSVPLSVEYYVDIEAGVTWYPWANGACLGWQLRYHDGSETVYLYTDPLTSARHMGPHGSTDLDERIGDA